MPISSTPVYPPHSTRASVTQRPHDPKADSPSDAQLRKKAGEFEASFLSQMLQDAKIGMPDDKGSDNLVTQNFSSFMSKAYADQIVKSGGVGLSEPIFQALKATPH